MSMVADGLIRAGIAIVVNRRNCFGVTFAMPAKLAACSPTMALKKKQPLQLRQEEVC